MISPRSSPSRCRRTWASFRQPRGFWSCCANGRDATGALLILDEVISGFRVARGGAQELTGVRGDLVLMGKIIGGGLPAGARWGQAGADGAARAGRRRLPGGDALGQPARDGRGPRDAGAARRRGLRAPRGDDRARSPTGCAMQASARASWSRASPDCSRSSSASGPCGASRTRSHATPSALQRGAGSYSRAASTRRRRSSRPGSPRSRTPRSRSSARRGRTRRIR